MFCHEIDEQRLITLLDYQNIKRDTNTRHKRNYMRVGARVQSHTSKLKRETNDDIFRSLQKTGNPAGNRLMISNFNIIKKYGQKVSK